MRLLDLLAEALRTVKDGADARTRLEAALVKAAAPEVDPAARALMARVERLEAGSPATRAGAAAPPSRAARSRRARRRRRRSRRPHPPAGARGGAAAPGEPPAPSTHRSLAAIHAAGRSREAASRAEPRGVPTPTRAALADDPASTPSARSGPPSSTPCAPTTACSPPAWPRRIPVEVRGSEVVVAFAEHDTFNRKMADGREHRAAVDDALRGLAGARCAWSTSCASWRSDAERRAALRGRARRTLQDGVRRRGDRPRRSATRRAGGQT